jgi:hypothetical protein
MNVNSDLASGKLEVFDKFDISAASGEYNATPTFASIGSEYVIAVMDLERVEKLTSFRYDTLGLTTTRYLNSYFRISRDGNAWSDWLALNRDFDTFPVVDPLDKLHIELKWVRAGSSAIGTIRILEYYIGGEVLRNEIADGSAVQLQPGKEAILKAPFIYKVFSLSDIEVLSNSDLSSVDIKYRFSQDSERTWSQWEKLTKDNISTVRINPIRFFQVEYLIHNNSASNVSIQDINLIGDFQNVSKDYFKSNLMGIRECCQSNKVGYMDANGNWIDGGANSGSLGNSIAGSGGACATDGDGSVLPKMTSDEKASLYNPYQQNTAMSLLNKLSSDAQQVFGHKVIYFATDPDKKGQDHTMHEYQLYNVSCQGDLKVSVEGNNFPDSQIAMNQFDLSLFEAMEVHITKEQFKQVFGPHRRPAKEDFLYFCDVNRMYSVDHAQQFRNFNNAAVYYKLHLKKYNKAANVKIDSKEVKNTLDKLTKNTTIDELFGIEQGQDKASIANKDQLKPLTKDPIRLEYLVEIDKELIENSSTIISKAHYDLSSVDYGTTAVRYKNLDPLLKVSDNIGFMLWFSINNYVMDETYTLFTNHDPSRNLGWKAELKNDIVKVTANGASYSWSLYSGAGNDTVALDEETWYCYVMNIDQRNGKMSQYVYKRDTDDEEAAASLVSTILRRVYKDERDFERFEYIMEDNYCRMVGSDMKATNIRLFADVIPESMHNKILNQYILGDDSKHLVFADNATTRIYLPNFPYNE